MQGEKIKALEYQRVGQHQGFEDGVGYQLRGLKAHVTIGYDRLVGESIETITMTTTLLESDIDKFSDSAKAELSAICEAKLEALLPETVV